MSLQQKNFFGRATSQANCDLLEQRSLLWREARL
jgi:hypothetical protein